jgi:uncharacterized protein YecE (DUF72 family)
VATGSRWSSLKRRGTGRFYEDLTADFVYMRLHGDQELYRSGYDDAALTRWAQRIRAWSAGREPSDARKIVDMKLLSSGARDVYCFFDNTDAKSRAPFDAQTLMQKLGLGPSCLTASPFPARPSHGAVRPASKTSDGRQGR